MSCVDTHCHLDIIQSRGIEPEQALRNAEARGIRAVVQIATDLQSSMWNCDLADKINPLASGFPKIY